MQGQDSFGLAVCEEVPKTTVERITGKVIERTEDHSSTTDTGCSYFTDKTKQEHILIQVSYLSAENQKQGQQTLGRTITTDASIPMENFIATQENGQINAVYLVMADNKFVRVDRTANTIDNDRLLDLARQITPIITGH